jgi:hypothetical protein
MSNPKFEEEKKAEETLWSLVELCNLMARGHISGDIAKVKVNSWDEYAEKLFTDKTPPKTMLCAVAICTACEDIIEKINFDEENEFLWHRVAVKLMNNYQDIKSRTRSIVEKGPKVIGCINIDEIHELYRLGN